MTTAFGNKVRFPSILVVAALLRQLKARIEGDIMGVRLSIYNDGTYKLLTESEWQWHRPSPPSPLYTATGNLTLNTDCLDLALRLVDEVREQHEQWNA